MGQGWIVGADDSARGRKQEGALLVQKVAGFLQKRILGDVLVFFPLSGSLGTLVWGGFWYCM